MSRLPPAKVTPIVVGNIQYGENSGYNSHLLPVIDVRTGQKIKDIDLYHYAIDPDVETDVQEVYVRAMSRSRDGKGIVIENEHGHRFLLNTQDQTTRELNHPCSLKLVDAVKLADTWSVRVELSTTNVRPGEDFYLDRLSFGDTQELRNNLFEVSSANAELAYRGAMVKRAPPDGVDRLDIRRPPGQARTVAVPAAFALLEPGQSHTVTIELGRHYAFPPEGGTFRIRYRHHNHFSPNNVDLESNPITVTLDPHRLVTAKPAIPTR